MPTHAPRPPRAYAALTQAAVASVGAAHAAPAPQRGQAMQRFVDAAWPELAPHAVSWLGFYLRDPAAPAGQELILGPRRDKPACSPIGLHGACGRALLSKRPLIVTDVAKLGPGYIACDPRDRSELVIPCTDPDGVCWGVLDLDSFDPAAFDHADAHALIAALAAHGLTATHALGPIETV